MFSMRAQRLLRSMRGTRASRAARSPWASSVTLPSQLLATQPVRPDAGPRRGHNSGSYALHCAGEAPAAADGAHASMPVTV